MFADRTKKTSDVLKKLTLKSDSLNMDHNNNENLDRMAFLSRLSCSFGDIINFKNLVSLILLGTTILDLFSISSKKELEDYFFELTHVMLFLNIITQMLQYDKITKLIKNLCPELAKLVPEENLKNVSIKLAMLVMFLYWPIVFDPKSMDDPQEAADTIMVHGAIILMQYFQFLYNGDKYLSIFNCGDGNKKFNCRILFDDLSMYMFYVGWSAMYTNAANTDLYNGLIKWHGDGLEPTMMLFAEALAGTLFIDSVLLKGIDAIKVKCSSKNSLDENSGNSTCCICWCSNFNKSSNDNPNEITALTQNETPMLSQC
ncbi:MAG: hypothetical protein GY821_06720 [Gammaproteobacteria bacterium]|nr:hypothetical protein [Gammaproteobacteria bacterium]